MIFNIWKNTDLKDIPGENWEDIPDYVGLYSISNLGRVKSMERIIYTKDHRELLIKERILKQAHKKKKNSKYLYVALSKESKLRTFEVHRLVGMVFLEGNGECIIHRDSNTLNNVSTNLEYNTFSEKNQLSWDREFSYSSNIGKFGSDSATAKETKMLDLDGKELDKFGSRVEAAEWLIDNNKTQNTKINTLVSSINKCIKGVLKTAYGYKWK